MPAAKNIEEVRTEKPEYLHKSEFGNLIALCWFKRLLFSTNLTCVYVLQSQLNSHFIHYPDL